MRDCAEYECEQLHLPLLDSGSSPARGARSWRSAVPSAAAICHRTTAVSDGAGVPSARLVLHQNAPNPFNPATTIAFELPQRSRVEVGIYDVTGRLVTTLLRDELDRGRHVVRWNATGVGRRVASSGVYLYRLKAESISGTWRQREVRSMTLVR